MNGFADIAVGFGSPTPPATTRLGNPWTTTGEGPDRIWLSQGSDDLSISASTSGPWTVWAVGEVFAYRGSEAGPVARFTDDLSKRRADPAELDAHAVLIAWNAATRQTHVWVDRFGTMHIYVGGAPGQTRLSTVFASVAESSAGELDWIGITGFCGFGFYVGDRTPYEDVRILRPATHTVFDDIGREVSQRRYWDWSYEPEERQDEDVIDEFHQLWTTTLGRQVAGHRPVVPISGGLDSRTILAGLTGTAPVGLTPPALFTYGYSATSQETRIARRVAEARGLPIHEFVVQPYLFDRLDDVIGSVEGFAALSLPRQAGVSNQIAPLGDRVVGGHWGDVWFDSSGVPASATSRPGNLVEAAFAKFAKNGREWLFDHLCRPNLAGQDPAQVLREVLRAELERLPDLGDADMQLKALKTEQWSFRWTLAGTRAYHLAHPTLLPFYANDVVDFFRRVPSKQVVGRRLQAAYLRRHHPDLARVAWQDSGMSLFERRWEPSAALARRALARGGRTIRGRRITERNWEVQYLSVTAGDHSERPDPIYISEPIEPHTREQFKQLNARLRSEPSAANGYAFDELSTIAAILPELNGRLGGGAGTSDLRGEPPWV